jgi:hypothetical protein
MKKISVFIIILLVIVLSAYMLFKGCSNSVSYFDGERKVRMVKLQDDYYYSKIDKTIWLKENETDSYKRILEGKVDSLIWNGDIIIGYSDERYFLIDVSAQSLKYEKERSRVLSLVLSNKVDSFKAIDDMPSMFGVKK